MYHTILVPLDGTRQAEAILPQAEELARSHEARLVLLRVLQPVPALIHIPGPYGTWSADMQTHAWDNATVYLAGKRGELRELGLQASSCLEAGPAVETILRVAAQCGADLIAMASHGRTALEQLAARSVAAGVLHGANCPLLLVRSSD
ncbi:MAG: universal stress protein [Anaerolineales bacterium]